MSASDFAALVALFGIAVASPGPGVAAIVARGLTEGTRGAPAFVAGFLIGDLLWLLIVATGLATLARTAAPLLSVVKFAGALYLLYLAYRLWTRAATPVDLAPTSKAASPWKLVLAGLAQTVGNPKSMVFFLAILPSFVSFETLSPLGVMQIAAIIIVLDSLVLGAYAVTAARAKRLLSDSRALTVVNRVFGVLLAVAAVTIALR